MKQSVRGSSPLRAAQCAATVAPVTLDASKERILILLETCDAQEVKVLICGGGRAGLMRHPAKMLTLATGSPGSNPGRRANRVIRLPLWFLLGLVN